jgi:glycosyltransferase involved in cell wall biosynthesis
VLRGQPDENPLLHYLRHRGQPGIHPRLPEGETTIPREMRRFAAPGPDFETVAPLPDGLAARALVLAFYLPQFHPLPENDAWWGDGFTEWTNTSRALPRFAGHYQPRIPRDLGHYRLDDPATLRRQVKLARGAGLGGFAFYFYWFDGKRLLDRPLEALLADRGIDFPFCLIWANENWSRRWDGSDDEVLIAQTYRQADEAALIGAFARHFADPRYIRLQGRPLLMIYRAGLIPDAAASLARWRARFRTDHGEDPILVMAQSFGEEDPRRFGLDGAVEFPPHKLVRGLPAINARLDLLDHEFDAQVYAYDDLAEAGGAAPEPAYPLLRTALPGWDNDARRQGRGMVLHGATPARYQAWLDQLIGAARARPFFGTPMVCVNAWNEWAEGAYLEPDQHFGAAFLNATGRAIAGLTEVSSGAGLLLVGHDAFAAGAQLLLLHLGRQLRRAHGVRVAFALCGGGSLEPGYAAVAPVTRAADADGLAALAARLRRQGVRHAVVNSAASAWCCGVLAAQGFAVTLLVHEMPMLLAERHLIAPLQLALGSVAALVFAAEAVRAAVAGVVSLDGVPTRILPQGVYRDMTPEPESAARLRAGWGIPDDALLAVGMGHADLRKGFDLFLQVWRLAAKQCPALHMVWVGSVDPGLRGWLGAEIAQAEATGRFRLTGWRDDIATVLAAADLLALTSREDAYPSVVLEALQAGAAVVAFDDSGGSPDLLRKTGLGSVVGMADCAGMARVIGRTGRRARAVTPAPSFPFDRYAADLLRLAWPDRASVAVVVTCYRHAALLPRRLDSIFQQTVPVEQVAVWDDASDDASVAVARDCAASAGRSIDIVQAARNSGSPFGHWREAVARARGDLVWIAEADDACEPGFLAHLLPAFAAPETVLAFCDSHPIDRDGQARPEQYRQSYEAVGGPGALSRDETFDAADFLHRYLAERNVLFNVSAVVWRRSALLAALDRLGDELGNWKVAGDWRLYVEVLGAGGRVAYVARTLNRHCRDAATASALLPAVEHLGEIRRMQGLVRRRIGKVPGLAQRQALFLAQASAHLRLG